MIVMTYTRDEQIQIANTIISQLGGYGKLKAMIGINGQCALNSGLQFNFKGSRDMNKCTIELNDMDTYDVKFYKIPHLSSSANPAALDRYLKKIDRCKTPISEFNSIYADMLIGVFEEETGLNLSL